MRLLINNGLGNIDYTAHVVDGSISIEDSINVPTLITFQLSPVNNFFVKPSRSAYVTLVSDILAPGTGYGSGKILATGFITNEPERQFLGLSQNRGPYKFAQYVYNINVTSDEWLLNCNTVPYIPAFVNQTDSQIIASIAQALMPGFFDTTTKVAAGTLIPFYQYDPSQTWSDIVKTFADANRYYYKVINKQLIYQPFGDSGLGIAYNDQTQKEAQLAPLELKTGVITVPPVNDCTVIGDTEPQGNWDTYFVGDGFTSNFQLRYPMFQGTSSDLLNDPWSESSFTTGQWNVNNPQGSITLVDGNGNALGSLNLVQKGALGTYTPQVNATFIQAVNGLELGGGINLQHGQFVFNDTASGGGGIVGGVYPSSSFLPGNVICGFAITGQAPQGPFNVIQVQQNANSNLFILTLTGAMTLQTGNVIVASNFINATILNGMKLAVVSIVGYTQNGIQFWTVTVIQSQTFANPYGPTADFGSIIANVNDVLVTASGAAGIAIQPILSGAFVGPIVLSQINHQYVLQTWIGAQTPTRYTRQYTNLTQTQTFGAQNIAASGTISWVITDYDLGVYVIEQQNPLFGLFPSAPPPVVTKYTVGPNLVLPGFALYCLVNGIDLNISINYTDLSLPPQGFLTVQSLTGMSGGRLPWFPTQLSAPIHYQLGFGMINQTAQISQQGEAFALSFYTDDIPAVGARIRFQAWAAGQSIARVRDPVAIANEARVTGDSGVRAAILQNLSPTPRTSAECEAAAGAAILDREYPQFQGTYTVTAIPGKFESLWAPSLYDMPRTGRFFYINSQVRGITGQNFFVNTVRIQVIEMKSEVMTCAIDYGPDLYLEKLLPAFLEREQNLLVPTQTVKPPNPITLLQVLNAYLPTLDNARVISMTNTLAGDFITIDLGAPPITACEVRNVDNGWGIAGQGRVGLFTTQQFTLPRTNRNQTWYLRAINGAQFSRFSKALNVQYPLIPSAPGLQAVNSQTLSLQLAGDVRDIYGLELRAVLPPSGAFYFQLPLNPVTGLPFFDQIAYFNRSALPTTPPYNLNGNAIAVYAPVGTTTPSYSVQLGDMIFLTCPTDGSFAGMKLVTGVGQNTFSTSGISYFRPSTASGDIAQSDPFAFYPPPYAFDNNLSTAATAVRVFNYAGNPATYKLEYSTNGGTTWNLVYSFNAIYPFHAGTTFQSGNIRNAIDSIALPAGIQLGNVAVRVTFTAAAQNNQTIWYGFPSRTTVAGDTLYVASQTMLWGPLVSGLFQAQFNVFEIYVQGNAQATYSFFSWFDYADPYPDSQGILTYGSNFNAGNLQLYGNTVFNATVSGAITGANIATLVTALPHGYTPGTAIINSCGWFPPAPSNVIAQDGAPMSGQFTVTAVLDPFTFQIQLPSWTRGNVYPLVGMVGATAALPVPQQVGLVTVNGISGVLLQRVVTSPSDLVINYTQPPVSTFLGIIQALTPGGRVLGINAYFFNLTWDYSAPTPIPGLTVPALTGVVIDLPSQNIVWGVSQGIPSGHRVETYSTVDGSLLSKYTVDHPQNPQLLRRAFMTFADYQNPRQIKITPFDGFGDGIPTVINWAGASGTPGAPPFGGGGLPTGQIGDILRFNVNNDNTWDPVNSSSATKSLWLYAAWDVNSSNTLSAIGITTGGGGNWTGMTEASVKPLPAFGWGQKFTSPTTANTVTVIGSWYGTNGNNSLYPILAFYRYTCIGAIGQLTNARFWIGLICFNVGSSIGNSASPANSTAYANDLPNKTTLGFRYSAGTDTTWKAVSIQAGGGSTVVDTGVTPDLNIHSFEMAPNSTGTSVNFLIDGIIVAVISTNLPITGLANPADSLCSPMWCGDNKNTANAVSFTWYGTGFSIK